MKTFLVDASVWLAAVDDDDRSRAAAREFLRAAQSGEYQLGALDLTLIETTNIAVTKWKSPGHARLLARSIGAGCTGRIARVQPENVSLIASLAIDHGLSGYDAAHVTASTELAWELVSLDYADLISKELAVSPDAVN